MIGRPRVSVVISSFNYEQFVADTIRSALDQDLRDAEVIVVDDGSQDGSHRAIASFGDRVTAIFKDNGGQASALNAGFRSSRGESVIFLDSDDLLLPGAVAAVAEATSDPSVAKAHWSLPIVDAEGRRTGAVQDPELAVGDFRQSVLRDGPLNDMTMPSPPMSGNAFPRWFLERVMPIPEDLYHTMADEYLFGLAPAFGRIVRLPSQSLYRIHGENHHIGWSFERMLSFQEAHQAIVARVVAEAYRGEGLAFEESVWKRSAWWLRAGRVARAIVEVVPAGGQLALIDDGALGIGPELRGRRVHAVPEADGEFAGAPADDRAALAELEQLDRRGIEYVALAWPAFWWLEEYPRMASALRGTRAVLVEEPNVLIFGPRAG